MFRCRAAYESGESYEPLLAKPAAAHRVHPYVFLSLGFIHLWSGSRPRITRRLLQHAALRANGATAKALIWAIWADMSPLSLRTLMRALLRRRNKRAAAQLGSTALCEWRRDLPQRGRAGASPHFIPAAAADPA
jgi:hypothetical protein